MEKAGAGKAGHEGDGAEDVDDVVDVEAVARALDAADAGEGAVQAVAEPVEGEAEDDGEQSVAVEAREGVEDAGGDLRGEAEEGELVGGEPARGAFGDPLEGALFDCGGEGVVDARRAGLMVCWLSIMVFVSGRLRTVGDFIGYGFVFRCFVRLRFSLAP